MAVQKAFAVVETYPASADLSSNQYYFVERSTGQLAACNAAGDVATMGVLQDKPTAQGRPGEIVRMGFTKVVASAAITAGDKITTTNAGKAVTVDPTGAGGDAGYAVLGEALETATADGQIISAVINCINPPCAANTYS